MKIYNLRELIRNMPDEADISVLSAGNSTWKRFAWLLLAYFAGYCFIRFLADGSQAEAIIGGWVLQLLWLQD